jgi:prepilin-type N-terminal cleavage/methylation domain-containing protein
MKNPRPPNPPSPPPPRGYTLIEILIVLAILALLAGMVWPLLAGGSEEQTRRQAAWDVLVACRYARSESVASGWMHVLRYEASAEPPVFRLTAVPPGGGPEDAVAAQPPYDRPVGFPADTEVLVEPAAEADAERDQSADAPALYFYPDGTSDGGRIELTGPRRTFRIQVQPYTGRSELQELWTAELEAEQLESGPEDRP